MDLFSEIFTKEMALLAVASITVMLFIGRIPFKGKQLNDTNTWSGYGIFILLIFCVCGAFVPGIRPEGEWGNAIVFGLVSAIIAHTGRKVARPFLLKRLERKDGDE